MKILIALTYYRPHYSGLTIHAEREARALSARGHQVTILTSRYSTELPPQEIRDGIQIVRPRVWLHVSKGVIMPSMPLWAWRLTRQADVIHLHTPQLDAAPIALISRFLGKPIVLTYHCDLMLPKGFIHSLANRVSDLANHITAQLSSVIVHNTRDYAENSPFLRGYLERLFPIFPPVEVAPPTQETNASFRARAVIQPGDRLIGMAARLATEKGVEYLAQAMPIVMQRHPSARVLFVGPYQNIVGEEQYAQHLSPLLDSLGDHWKFLGILPPQEFSAFLSQCEVTVLPSINSTESYGLVQVESMMCGTPVVASDLPGVRVPVQSTGMGKIFPHADAGALAEALIEVLDHTDRYHGDPSAFIRLSSPESVAIEYEKAFDLARQRLTKTQPAPQKQVG